MANKEWCVPVEDLLKQKEKDIILVTCAYGGGWSPAIVASLRGKFRFLLRGLKDLIYTPPAELELLRECVTQLAFPHIITHSEFEKFENFFGPGGHLLALKPVVLFVPYELVPAKRQIIKKLEMRGIEYGRNH